MDDKTPVKRTVFKNKYMPWMNPDLLTEIRDKNKLFQKWQRTRLDHYRYTWLKLKFRILNQCQKAEHDYLAKILSNYEDPETDWGYAKKYTGEKTAGSPSQVVSDGKLMNDPTEVATACNIALLNKVETSVAAIPPTIIKIPFNTPEIMWLLKTSATLILHVAI